MKNKFSHFFAIKHFKFTSGLITLLLLATLILPQPAHAGFFSQLKCFFSWIFTSNTCEERMEVTTSPSPAKAPTEGGALEGLTLEKIQSLIDENLYIYSQTHPYLPSLIPTERGGNMEGNSTLITLDRGQAHGANKRQSRPRGSGQVLSAHATNPNFVTYDALDRQVAAIYNSFENTLEVINTSNITEGSKLFYTDTRVADYINASSTLSQASQNYWTKSGTDLTYTAGNVGIGTSTPAAKLSITGSGLTTGRAFVVADSSNADRFSVLDSGRVVIGTTAPATLGALTIIQPTDGSITGGILLYDNAQTSGGGMFREATNFGALVFRNQSLNTLYVVSGKIGIGTSTPNNKLDIYSTTKSAIGFSGASGDTYKWTLGMDVTNGGRFSIASSTALGTDDMFVINGGGNVGVGTTSPSQALSIQGSGLFSGTLSVTGTGTRTFAGGVSAAGLSTSNGLIVSSGNVWIGSSSPAIGTNLDITYESTTADTIQMTRFTPSSSGVSLIGRKARGTAAVPTAVPANDHLLFIGARGYDGSAFGGNTGAIVFKSAETFTTTAKGTYITFETVPMGSTSRSEKMRVDASGNIGIGVTNPQTILDIAATSTDTGWGNQVNFRSFRAAIVSGNFLGGLTFTSNDTTLTAPGTTTDAIQPISNSTHTASELGTDIVFKSTTGTTYAELMRLTGAGKLGIGTATPDVKLQVSGGQHRFNK